jgi:hypothetical protein
MRRWSSARRLGKCRRKQEWATALGQPATHIVARPCTQRIENKHHCTVAHMLLLLYTQGVIGSNPVPRTKLPSQRTSTRRSSAKGSRVILRRDPAVLHRDPAVPAKRLAGSFEGTPRLLLRNTPFLRSDAAVPLRRHRHSFEGTPRFLRRDSPFPSKEGPILMKQPRPPLQGSRRRFEGSQRLLTRDVCVPSKRLAVPSKGRRVISSNQRPGNSAVKPKSRYRSITYAVSRRVVDFLARTVLMRLSRRGDT